MLHKVIHQLWKYRLPLTILAFLAFLAFLSVLAGTFITATILEILEACAVIRADAITRYGGDEVTALAKYVDDQTNRFKQRNYAIGMLANLRDARALPVLEKHWTGSDDANCGNGYANLCQYELKKKAVEQSRRDLGPNIITRILQM